MAEFLRMLRVLILLTLAVSEVQPCFPGRAQGRYQRFGRQLPLIYKEHVPNAHETSTAAAGPSEGRIKRDSTGFDRLLANYNPDIVFKDEERNGEDRMMSRRCKEKVDNLAMLVPNYWPNVKLRITEAYDTNGFHAYDSLHYEGRAVDITTSDLDRGKYGMLARLAVQAGFDYVHYESRAHVHVSVKSDNNPDIPKLRGCFGASTFVQTESRGRIPVSSLKPGDLVLSLSRDFDLIYSPVIAFLDFEPSAVARFVEIRTPSRILQLTATHLIYKALNSSGQRPQLEADFAAALQPGDILAINQPINNTQRLIFEPVLSLDFVVSSGFYAPLTLEGNIFADDILASCYSSVSSEFLAHSSFGPFRLLWRLQQTLASAFGWAKKGDGITPQIGHHWYADMLLKFAENVLGWEIL